MSIAAHPAWQALDAHVETLRDTHLRDLFAGDPQRFERFSVEADGLLFDYSKQRVTEQTMSLLAALADAADVRGWTRRMYAGEAINASENRAALHIALRHREESLLMHASGENVMPKVRATQAQMRRFCDAVRSGAHRGFSGDAIRAVVNIGIGGSDLGPRMATIALDAHAHPGLEIHYVSNLDAADLAPRLQRLDPRTTLFIVTSKTFTTLETLSNARTARDWLLAAAGDAADLAMRQQFVAVTAAPTEAVRFGIAAEHLFEFWDWVGGRFSLWSAVGLPLALAIGMTAFDAMLDGANAMDRHFREAPTRENIPLLMALLGIWNINFLGAWNLSVSPYSQSLRAFPDYLQQLDMESNGKSLRHDGQPVGAHTAPVLWGGAGSNTQHAYFQMLHQGGVLIPSDFIAFVESDFPLPGHHEKLLANCFAQSEALAFGSAHNDPLRQCPGNQPSSTLLLPKLDPFRLGQLIAAYEHKVCAQAAIWGINPFDQWGVELGKKLAARLVPAIESPDSTSQPECDASTAGLINWYHRNRSAP